jgi:hypothetical protein
MQAGWCRDTDPGMEQVAYQNRATCQGGISSRLGNTRERGKSETGDEM